MIVAPTADTTPTPASPGHARIESAATRIGRLAGAADEAPDQELRMLQADLLQLLRDAPGMAAWVERIAAWEIERRI